ncbi:DUF4176 domain-containing protein [Enterococcus faecium]|uniref:DUF4176 domain-containing protein n=1 Tax=Enterococcus faecium TaxID=1352 RepID=UPI00398E67F3
MKKLFSATFEQSLNLLDDQLVVYMINKGDPKSLRNKPWINTFFLVLIFGFCYLISRLYYHQDSNSPVGLATINLFPSWIIYIFFFVWLLCIIYVKKFIYRENEQVVFLLNSNNLLLIMIVSLNLFFITFFLKPLTIIGMSLLLSILVLVGYIVFRTKKRSLENVLYETKTKKDKIDKLVEKVLKLVMKYGWILVTIVMLWKLIFPSSNEVRTDVVGFIGLVSMWIVADIGFIVAEAYLFFPYLLHGYYKYKYPEEYREWEGKTQLEWYGEKYFNKHIKGTEKEEKIND